MADEALGSSGKRVTAIPADASVVMLSSGGLGSVWVGWLQPCFGCKWERREVLYMEGSCARALHWNLGSLYVDRG